MNVKPFEHDLLQQRLIVARWLVTADPRLIEDIQDGADIPILVLNGLLRSV